MDPRHRLTHFLRRAGFGVAPGELERRLSEGYEATVRAFVEPGGDGDGLSELDHQIGGILDFANIDDVRTWWVYRMIQSRQPLVEKMAFFWHGHFATAMSKVGNAYLMYQQNQLFREHGLGNFEDLLQRVARDPAMLNYLDGSSNKKGKPNENFAREVMELFTTGIGPYTEQDVQEAARAFTGWGLKDNAFAFTPGDHDEGPKTVLGHAGPLDGADVLHLVAEHPATATHLVKKLFAFFAYDDPEPAALAPLLAVWKDTRGSIREVLRALFLSPAFSSPRAWRARIKSPAELVIGAIRALGGTFTPRQVVGLLGRMGQDLFNPPSVKGWDGGPAWISTSTMFERINFASSLTTARGPEGTSHVVPESVFNGLVPTTAEQALSLAAEHLVDGQLSDTGRAAILEYFATADPQGPKDGKGVPFGPFADKRAWDTKLRGLLHLVLSSPEFQLS
jgi:uncharacterized protein (DUF1800 family)